jgi:hypothetical protein
MGQINVEDLERMATDATRAERCSATKNVLEAVRDAVAPALVKNVYYQHGFGSISDKN